MKKIIVATAISLMVGTSALAGSHMSTAGYVETQARDDVLASKFIGARIYATEKEIEPNSSAEKGAESEWDDIGEVNDVLLAKDGSIKAVILGVGGFIGIGEKDVAVPMTLIKKVFEEGADDKDDYFLVINANKQLLTDAPEFKRMAMMKNETSAKPMKMDGDRAMLKRPHVKLDGYDMAKIEDLTASDLEGARVYGVKDENVGEINKLVLDANGKIKHAVLDIGGFLGIGEHQIAVTMEELNIVRNKDGDVKIFINSTQEALKEQPVYKG